MLRVKQSGALATTVKIQAALAKVNTPEIEEPIAEEMVETPDTGSIKSIDEPIAEEEIEEPSAEEMVETSDTEYTKSIDEPIAEEPKTLVVETAVKTFEKCLVGLKKIMSNEVDDLMKRLTSIIQDRDERKVFTSLLNDIVEGVNGENDRKILLNSHVDRIIHLKSELEEAKKENSYSNKRLATAARSNMRKKRRSKKFNNMLQDLTNKLEEAEKENAISNISLQDLEHDMDEMKRDHVLEKLRFKLDREKIENELERVKGIYS